MQKIVTFLFTLIVLLCGCSQEEQPKPVRHILVDIDTLPPTPHTLRDTAAFNKRQHDIQRELTYYLKRHTVDDEGYDMVARYAEQGDTLLKAYRPQLPASAIGMLRLSSIARQGLGIERDTMGRVYLALWRCDTLFMGLRFDPKGVYAGHFNASMQAEGHGAYRSVDGSYYEGHWQADQREGFGFFVNTTILQAGTWRKDKFFGEHIQHTSDRIYGIDISRYQHEKGRKRFGINWSNLRVTHLGRRIKGNITGEVDYPVRFVYIKSTQGTSIRNRYLMTDYAAARKRGLAVGTYHFFSTVQSGRAQANYYLTHTLFKKGDLPPVLDIEPTNKQINKMGGTAALLREIRTWIAMVERRLHVRPILYVNQRFVNEHLIQAPDLLSDYQIWIARYGEYKPGIHLALWQLSSDARVSGIQTEVDVNVFNGYEQQWQEFLEEETIR